MGLRKMNARPVAPEQAAQSVYQWYRVDQPPPIFTHDSEDKPLYSRVVLVAGTALGPISNERTAVIAIGWYDYEKRQWIIAGLDPTVSAFQIHSWGFLPQLPDELQVKADAP